MREEFETYEDIEKAAAEVDDLHSGLAYDLSVLLFSWSIRWAIGFWLVWAITSSTGRYDWLWDAAIAVAAISLFLKVYLQIVIDHKVRRTKAKLALLSELMEEEEVED